MDGNRCTVVRKKVTHTHKEEAATEQTVLGAVYTGRSWGITELPIHPLENSKHGGGIAGALAGEGRMLSEPGVGR